MTDIRRITLAEFQAECKAQGVDRMDMATICPVCGTVQSMRSLIAAGADPDTVERFAGFSCEGRWTDAGPYIAKMRKRDGKRGCDWTLGGLFRIHKLEVEAPADTSIGRVAGTFPFFEIATAEQAKALRDQLDAEGK